jgi:asparagine synthase (glutamine-hydrolysing)
VTGALAGQHAPAPDAALLERAAPGADIAAFGPLLLTREPGPAPLARGEVVCALHGRLYETEPLARELGLGADAAPEAILTTGWRRLGDGLLGRLRGDFALVLYDRERGEGLVARDQMGGRPLWWAAGGGGVVFSTDPPLLLRLLARTPGPDAVAVAHWLARSAPPGDRTLYDRVARLEAGCLLRLRAGGTHGPVERWWRPAFREPLRDPRPELVDALRERLARAVERRVGGEPDALMLSGGLDSGAVAALARAAPAPERRPSRAYSAVFPDHPAVDEDELIAELREQLGLAGTRAVVRGGSVLAGAIPYLERYALPPVSPNMFFWLPLLRRAREQGTVALLDGEGGDELFGLSPMLIADRVRAGRILAARELAARTPGPGGQPAPPGAAGRILRAWGLKGAVPGPIHRAVRRVRGGDRYAPPLLAPHARRAFLSGLDDTDWKRRGDPRWWSWLVEVVTRGTGVALVHDHVSRRAGLAGLEARHPLVDVDVVELVLRLPPELAFDPALSRPLLREAVGGALPDRIRLRPSKSSFDAIFHDAITEADLDPLRSLLGAPDARIRAHVDERALRERYLEGTPPRAPAVRGDWAVTGWRLATAELWLRNSEDPTFAATFRERSNLAPADLDLVSVARTALPVR